MKKMLFIMNPFAGQKRANRVLPDILLAFSEAGYEIQTVMTTGTGAATRAAEAHGKDVDLVVCCGGDCCTPAPRRPLATSPPALPTILPPAWG